MGKKSITATLTAFIIAFYVVIIMYVFFAVLHIDTLANFISAMIFEIIGFCLLTYFALGNILIKPIKTGYFVVKSIFVCKLPSGITVDNYAARRAACSSAIWCR
jgi:hypothetical protein